MLKLRSSFLQARPAKASTRPARSQAKRFLLVLGLSLVVAVPIFIITTRILPKDGIGRLFYWLHDAIYLPIKAYTFTRFYPFSISWWGPIALLLLVSTIAYLTGVSPTQDWHGRWLRFFLRHPASYSFLRRTTARFRRWRMDVLFMQEITSQERRKALLQLQILPFTIPAEEPNTRLFHLTRFHIQLLGLPPQSKARQLEAAQVWHLAYQQVCHRLSRHPQSHCLQDLTQQLAQMAESLLAPLVDWRQTTQLKVMLEAPPGFDLTSLMVDLFFLAALHNPILSEPLQSFPAYQPRAGQSFSHVVATRLAQSTAARQRLMDQTRLQVERMLSDEIDPLYFARNENPEVWPLLLGDSAAQQVTGALGLALALDVATMVPSPALALGFLESLEALDFQLHCLPPQVWENGMVHGLSGLPASTDYGWCAHLAHEELTAYEKAWHLMGESAQSPVTASDFQLARSRVDALYHAAGPDFQ